MMKVENRRVVQIHHVLPGVPAEIMAASRGREIFIILGYHEPAVSLAGIHMHKKTELMIIIVIGLIGFLCLLALPEGSGESRGNPNVNFHIANGYNVNEKYGDDTTADIFYWDKICLLSDVDDPDGDRIVSFEWTLRLDEAGTTNKTTKNDDAFSFTVGNEHLWKKNETGVKIVPVPNSEPVDYVIRLKVMDESGQYGEHTKWVTVHPEAQALFNKTVTHHGQQLQVSVILTWRGYLWEVANSSENVSEETPVFMNISKISSPDQNIYIRGGIGYTYSVKVKGCYQQDGEKGFSSAELSLPYLFKDIDEQGNPELLEKDLRVEYWDKVERRYLQCDNNHRTDQNGTYHAVGSMNSFETYMIIVNSIYNRDDSIAPELYPSAITFTPTPAMDTKNVTVHVLLKNDGIAHARGVQVWFYYDGAEKGKRTADLVRSNDTGTVLNYTFKAQMINSENDVEHHTIRVHVNKQRAINEGHMDNYDNNQRSRTMEIVPNATMVIASVSHSPRVPDYHDLVTTIVTLNSMGSREVKNVTVNFTVDGVSINVTDLGEVDAGALVNLTFNYTTPNRDHMIEVNLTYRYGGESFTERIWVTKPDVHLLSLNVTTLPESENYTMNHAITVRLHNLGNGTARNLTCTWYINGTFMWTYTQPRLHPTPHPIAHTYNWTAPDGNHTVLLNVSHDDGYQLIMANFSYQSPASEDPKDEPDDDDDGLIPIAGLDDLIVVGIGAVLIVLITVVLVLKRSRIRESVQSQISGAPPQTPGMGQGPPQPPQSIQTQPVPAPQPAFLPTPAQSWAPLPQQTPIPCQPTAPNDSWNCPQCHYQSKIQFAFCMSCENKRDNIR